MFKVRCTNGKKQYSWSGDGGVFDLLEVGRIYNVVSVRDSPTIPGRTMYILAEFSDQYGFSERFFSRIDFDEDELTEEQKAEAAAYDRQFAEILESMPDAI